MLCPNCHSQTETFCSKPRTPKKHKLCKLCGKPILDASTYCFPCSAKVRANKRPDKETLLSKLVFCTSISHLGQLLGATEGAARKWLRYYGLPYHAKDLKKYIQGLSNK